VKLTKECVCKYPAISGDRNVMKKEAEFLKYKDLTVAVQRTWNAKTKVIPVVIGAPGEPFQNHLENK
jgi:hypothetical protein